MSPWRDRLSVILFVSLLQGTSHGGSLQEIWKIDLAGMIDASIGQKIKDIPVSALRFSPNGEQIAAAVTVYLPGTKIISNLVVLETRQPNINIKAFRLQGPPDDYGTGSMPAITWSPSGEEITAGATAIRLLGRKTCDLPDDREYGFLGSHRIVGPVSPTGPARITGGIGPTKIDIFDEDCQLRDSWNLAQGVQIEDVFAERGLLYGRVTGPPGSMESIVIDSMTKITLGRMPFWGSGARFANGGRTICAGQSPDHPQPKPQARMPLRCFDVETGSTIAQAIKINDGRPIFAAESASRIIAHDVVPVHIPFTGGEYGTILKRRVVWDFQTNTEIVSWAPPTQAFDFYLGTDAPKRIKEPYRVAISPDGEYVVEGGNGIIRLYKIGP